MQVAILNDVRSFEETNYMYQITREIVIKMVFYHKLFYHQRMRKQGKLFLGR